MPNCKHCNTPISQHEEGESSIGRCLDAMIGLYYRGRLHVDDADLPHYSTDLNHAIKLWNDDWSLKRDGTTWFIDAGYLYFLSEAPTHALALCRAYLIEKMKEEGK